MTPNLERLQKFMAHAGLGSRRSCEKLIADGRVKVNRKTVTELGTQIDPATDEVVVDGRTITRVEAPVTLIMNKPYGVVTTVQDPQGRSTVMEYLPLGYEQRIYPVGRLDKNTTGLLLFTNDGELTYRVMHPKHELTKWYRATVQGVLSGKDLEALKKGIDIGDIVTSPAEATILEADDKCTVIMLGIHEGRKRQVRRMFSAIKHPVLELERTALGPLELGDLPPGECRSLTKSELSALREALGLEQFDG